MITSVSRFQQLAQIVQQIHALPTGIVQRVQTYVLRWKLIYQLGRMDYYCRPIQAAAEFGQRAAQYKRRVGLLVGRANLAVGGAAIVGGLALDYRGRQTSDLNSVLGARELYVKGGGLVVIGIGAFVGSRLLYGSEAIPSNLVSIFRVYGRGVRSWGLSIADAEKAIARFEQLASQLPGFDGAAEIAKLYRGLAAQTFSEGQTIPLLPIGYLLQRVLKSSWSFF